MEKSTAIMMVVVLGWFSIAAAIIVADHIFQKKSSRWKVVGWEMVGLGLLFCAIRYALRHWV